jgi:hypothetical protein
MTLVVEGRTMKAPFYVHASNRALIERILDLRDKDGNHVISTVQKDLLVIIGRFDRNSGNFMTTKNLRDSIPGRKVEVRTIRRHLRYLKAIGVVASERSGGKTRRRLLDPEPGERPSLKEFRESTGLSGYGKNKGQTLPSSGGANFASEGGKVCLQEGQDLPPSSLIEEEGEEMGMHLPKAPPQNFARASREMTVDRSGRPSCGGEPREGTPPPLESEKMKKKPKKEHTARERREEATRLTQQGHIVNPLGTPKRRGRVIHWRRAKVIGETGSVTVPQLWRAYHEAFEEAFGLDNLDELIAPTKERVSQYFDDMRQRFLSEAGKVASNRTIHGYILWMHAPERLKGLLRGSKKQFVHPSQLLGMVHIRRYYDQVLRVSEPDDGRHETEAGKQVRVRSQFIQDAYDRIRQAGNDLALTYCVANYGYVIVAEWLHDFKGMDGSRCRRELIRIFSGFLRGSSDAGAAEEFLGSAWKAAEANEKLFVSAVWEDWRENCKDIIELSRERAAREDD